MFFFVLAIIVPYTSAVQEEPKMLDLFNNSTTDTLKCIGECSYRDLFTKLPHEDCNYFCKCVLGHLKVKKCPKNKYFSIESKHCEFGKCEERKGCMGTCPEKNWPQGVTVLPHSDCKKYCKCQNGTALVKNCPYDFKFNIEHGICYPLNETKCIFDRNITTNTSKPGEFCIGSCSIDSDNFVFLPHSDCSKYCMCINNELIEQQCKGNLHFSSELNKCVTSAEANCPSTTSKL